MSQPTEDCSLSLILEVKIDDAGASGEEARGARVIGPKSKAWEDHGGTRDCGEKAPSEIAKAESTDDSA